MNRVNIPTQDKLSTEASSNGLHVDYLIDEFHKEFSSRGSSNNLRINSMNQMSTANLNNFVFNSNSSNMTNQDILGITTNARNNPDIILKENADLKHQKEQFIGQIQKNEELLKKANDIISHLKADISIDRLSQQIMNQTQLDSVNNNNFNRKRFSSIQDQSSFQAQNQSSFQAQNQSQTLNHTIIQQQSQQQNNSNNNNNHNILSYQLQQQPQSYQQQQFDLQDKLLQSNKNLQQRIVELNNANKQIKELEEKLMDRDSEFRFLQKDLEKYKKKLKQYAQKLQEKEEKSFLEVKNNNISQKRSLDYRDLEQEKIELERKLNITIKYNEEIFQNYTNLLQINQQLQNKTLEHENENMCLQDQIKELRDQIGILKAQENKLDHIEHDISRIEETSMVLPDLEKKLKVLKEDYNQKVQIISCCTEFLENQFKKTNSTLKDILQSENSGILVANLKFDELYEVASMSKNQEFQKLIQSMDYGNQIHSLCQSICRIAVAIVNECFMQPLNEKFQNMEKKYLIIESAIPKLIQIIKKQKNGLKHRALINEDINIQEHQEDSFITDYLINKKSFRFSFDEQDKENAGDYMNHRHFNKNVNEIEEVSIEPKIVNFIDQTLHKLEMFSKTQEEVQSSFNNQFKKAYEQNLMDYELKQHLKKFLDSNQFTWQKIENLTHYTRKEINSIKQDLVSYIKTQRQMQLPKLI